MRVVTCLPRQSLACPFRFECVRALLVPFGFLLLAALANAENASLPAAATPSPISTHGRTYTIAGLPQSDYTMDATYEHGTLVPLSCAGTVGYIIKPNDHVDPQRRWVWISNLFLALIDKDCGPVMQRFYVENLLANGFHIVGIDVGASCGSPAGADVYETFYQMLMNMDEYRLNRKAYMIGQSNGGLITYGYAFRHPDHVARVLGICPATDFTSWPGLDKICGAFAPAGLAYNLNKAEMQTRIKEFNPIENVSPLVKAGIKVYHIHGTNDTVVPIDPNSTEFAKRYKALGGDIQVEIVQDGGHGGPIKSFFESKAALDFLLKD
jgi:pimeloyl-ACP methyl ester carboxylesterase